MRPIKHTHSLFDLFYVFFFKPQKNQKMSIKNKESEMSFFLLKPIFTKIFGHKVQIFKHLLLANSWPII